MVVAAMVLSGLAAALHVYIFWLESFAWTRPATRATFGTTEDQAAATRDMAFNQGFYNLFLALVTVAGVVTLVLDARAVGVALIVAGAGSMVAAAVVLASTGRRYRGAALKQGALPSLALVCLALSAII